MLSTNICIYLRKATAFTVKSYNEKNEEWCREWKIFFDGVGDSALISLYLQKKLQIWVVLTCTIVAAKREKMFQKNKI